MSRVEVLTRFCEETGIRPVEVYGAGEADEYTITKEFAVTDLRALLKKLERDFPEILEWSPGLAIADGAVELHSAVVLQKKEIRDALSHLRGHRDARELTLRLTISKREVLTGKIADVEYLAHLLKTIGIDESIYESKDRNLPSFDVMAHVSGKDIKKLYIFSLDYLDATFQDCVGVYINDTGILSSAVLYSNTDPGEDGEPEGNLALIAGQDDDRTFEFNLNIDKGLLGKRVLGENNGYRHIVFLFEKNVPEFLKSPIPSLDRDLFANGIYSVIVTLQGDMLYHGRYLAIVSRPNIDRFLAMNLPAEVETAHTGVYRQLRRDRISWNNLSLNVVTPLHFMCDCVEDKKGDVADALATQLFHACILYTANLSTFDDETEELTSTYSGLDQAVKIALAAIPASWIAPEDLKWMAEWVYYLDAAPPGAQGREVRYSYRNTERLTIFQTVVTRKIADESTAAVDRFQNLAKNLGGIRKDIAWHYQVFLEGQIDKHTELVLKLEEEIAAAANNVSARLDSVTKGFIDMLITTIGVVILAAIGALLKGDASRAIFRISLWGYSAFLLVFHLAYRMGNIGHSYKILTRGIDARLVKYTHKFGEERITDLTVNLRAHRRMFAVWYWVTFCLYLAVIILLIFLGNHLPNLLNASPVPISAPAFLISGTWVENI